MVDAARKRADELGVKNAEFRQLDAEKMDLPDDSVDGVVCRWGFMLMADPAAALSETNRVLKPGGRISFAVWATADKNLWAATPAMVLVERGAMPAPEPARPGIFALGDQGRLEELVTSAGFAAPRIEEVPFTFEYEDLDFHWRATNELAGPVRGSACAAPRRRPAGGEGRGREAGRALQAQRWLRSSGDADRRRRRAEVAPAPFPSSSRKDKPSSYLDGRCFQPTLHPLMLSTQGRGSMRDEELIFTQPMVRNRKEEPDFFIGKLRSPVA